MCQPEYRLHLTALSTLFLGPDHTCVQYLVFKIPSPPISSLTTITVQEWHFCAAKCLEVFAGLVKIFVLIGGCFVVIRMDFTRVIFPELVKI